MKAIYLAAALAAFSAPALAQTDLTAQSFVKTAGVANMFEIQTSQLATKKSKNSEVKQFASEMIKDHTKAGNELKSLVKSGDAGNVQLPTKLDTEHAQKLKQLKAEFGADFDRTYTQMQLDAHKKAVSLFQSYSEQGNNAKLKTWAGKTLPTLQKHLEHAQQIQLPAQTGSLQK